MNLQISQMREKIREVYSGDGWVKRVRNMPNDQVIALYYKFLKQGKIKDVQLQSSRIYYLHISNSQSWSGNWNYRNVYSYRE